MNRLFSPRTLRLAPSALAASLALAGCSSIESLISGDKIDYRSASAARTQGLEVPPDLTQLARDSRFQTPGGVVSAAAATTGSAVRAAGPSVAPLSQGQVRIERQGEQRWLVVTLPPEQLWPQLKAFWQERGFILTLENAEAGVMETDWAENRAKIANDPIRNTIGKVFDSLYSTGERDRFRTRVERTATGSEVYISHRRMEEVYTGARDSTIWQPRPADPQLEAEFLSRMMVRLGTKEEAARTLVAAAPDQPARARTVSGRAGAQLEVDEPFDRAWRRVGQALDRSGFSVEDRDRAAGLYYVRYIDPKDAEKGEPGFFAKLFGNAPAASGPVRYRIALKGEGAKTTVSVLTSAGAPEAGENGQRIAGQLVGELK